MPPTPTTQKPVSISTEHQQVVLRPEDDDLFVRTGKQVIQACRLSISVDLWLTEIRAMFKEVAHWSDKQHLIACFAVLGSRVSLFVIPNGEQFDFDLADAIADLNTKLVKQYNVGMVEIVQIPSSEQDRFIDPDTARQVYGKPFSPYLPVEA